MEALGTSVLQGQPLVVVLLTIAIVFLWRDNQKERETRSALMREFLEGNAATRGALEKLADAIRNGKP